MDWARFTNPNQPADYHRVTREELAKQTRAWWEEAYDLDPYRTEENTRAVLGRDVFVWHNLSVPQLTALRRAVLPTLLEGRGF